jgi:microcin C transport system substrate-binding protein
MEPRERLRRASGLARKGKTMKKTLFILGAIVFASGLSAPAYSQKVYKAHAIAMQGQPKYRPDFKHFDYVNPDAPKGGTIINGAMGSFDSLNPFILKGQTAAGVGALFETLLTSSLDEPFTEYGLLAETIEWPEDRSWVAFTLRPQARWHDGKPVTVEDVIWSFETLKAKGHPFYQQYYKDVSSAEKVGERKVKFTFGGGPNPELPLITGQLPVLPKHYWQDRDFEATTLDPPIGSGPYRIKSLNPGKSITYELDPNYWGRNLPVNVGQDNFAIIRYDYYRDTAIQREAFKAGVIDFFSENMAKEWATGYNIPAVQQGVMIKREMPHENPQGMQAFVFNTRKDIFKDRRVREGIGYAFDFEWSNKNLFYSAYKRSTSFFSNSELAASGLPSQEELKILSKYRGRIPEEVFTREYSPPKTDSSGEIRANLRAALSLLSEAGWKVVDGKLTHAGTGKKMSFEILLDSSDFERIALPFTKNLERLGIEAKVNTVDTAQYQNRVDNFDFDIVTTSWQQSLSPGNEQRDFWGSHAADTPGSRNLVGIKDPVVDELIDLIITAPDRDSLVYRTRALDRILLWGHYVIPQWHISIYRVAYWDKFVSPKIRPKYALGLNTWWIDTAKETALEGRKRALR